MEQTGSKNNYLYPATVNRILLTMLLVITPVALNGQESPFYPVSYRLFTPFIFNPAVAGSKDYTSFDFILSNYGSSNSQMISGNTRLSNSRKEYFSSLETTEFTNIGVGGYLFNDNIDLTNNIGLGASGSYHFQTDKEALDFLSVGFSAKVIYNSYSIDEESGTADDKTVIPNIDAGVYYYTPQYYAGFSVTNILGTPERPDSLSFYTVPVSRQLFFHAGYKFPLSQALNLVIEPFIIVSSNDSLSGDISEMLNPGIKLYSGDVSVGTYLNDFSRISFFAEFHYHKLYLGTYFELPYNSAFYRTPMIVEFAAGLNFSAIRSGVHRRNHW
jgi:type IX secretion system PorP/SprF family membrane protein